MRFWTRSCFAYIEIHDDKFFVGKLEKRDSKFFCVNYNEHKFDKLELFCGVLYNSSVVYRYTKNFIDNNNMIGAKALVCCPGIKNYNGLKQQLIVLQISLSLGKAGLTIEKFLDEVLLKTE